MSKNFKTHAIEAIASIACLLSYSCQQPSQRSDIPITGFDYIMDIEVYDDRTKAIFRLQDTTKIFHYQNYVAYTKSFNHLKLGKVTKLQIGNETVLDQELLDDWVQYKYYVFQIGEQQGMLYDSISALSGGRFDIDSLVKTKQLSEKMFATSKRIVGTLLRDSGYTMIKKYVPIKKLDFTYSDSTYLYFQDAYKKIPYALSRKVDSLEQTKLCKAKFIYNIIPATDTREEIPRRELNFEIQPFALKNEAAVIKLFDRFKNTKL